MNRPKGQPVATDPGTLDLDNYVPYCLASLSRMLVQRMQARLGESSGLSIAEWRLMATVACHPNANAVDVCRLTQMDDVAVHRAVNRLAGKALLRREVSGHDRRRKRLDLTEEGWSVYRRVLPAALTLESEFLHLLDGGDRELFAGLLRRLHRLASQEATGADTRASRSTV